jgi:hypothetical protein
MNTGEPGRGGEVHLAERFAEVGVVLEPRLRPRRAPAPHLDVVGGLTAVRHRGVRQVRQVEREGLELALQRVERGGVGVELTLDPVHVGQDRRHVLALPLGLADAFAAGIALGLQRLGLDLQRLAPPLELLEAAEVERVAAPRELLAHAFGVAAQEFGIQHGARFYRD